MIAVATFGKVAGAYAGARLLSGQDHWSALAYGSGLNARGALEIIIATIGLSLGILTQDMFSVIVVMAVVTSLMAPVALRYTISHVQLDDEEALRLRKEAAMSNSFVGAIRRVLVPVRPHPETIGHTREMQAALLNRLADHHDMAITLFAVSPADDRQTASRYLSQVAGLFDLAVDTRVVTSHDPIGSILEETQADYDLLVLGTPAVRPGDENLFGGLIDDVVRLAPCPTLLMRGASEDESWEPRHILIPTNGTRSARIAADLAFAIASHDSKIEGVHIVTEGGIGALRSDMAREATSELEAVGIAVGHEARTHVHRATDAESGILAAVDEFERDLLVLGTSVRAGTARLHLGPRVEYLVRYAPCPVLIVNS